MELSSTKKLNKTPLGKTGCLSNLYYLLDAQASGFLIQPLSLTQSVKPHLVASHSPSNPPHLCDLWDAMPLHWSPSAFHPTLA